jgi:hypothetical protein
VQREGTIAQNPVVTRNHSGDAIRLAVSLIGHTLKREGLVRGHPFKCGHSYYKGEMASIVTGCQRGVQVLMFDLGKENRRE